MECYATKPPVNLDRMWADEKEWFFNIFKSFNILCPFHFLVITIIHYYKLCITIEYRSILWHCKLTEMNCRTMAENKAFKNGTFADMLAFWPLAGLYIILYVVERTVRERVSFETCLHTQIAISLCIKIWHTYVCMRTQIDRRKKYRRVVTWSFSSLKI